MGRPASFFRYLSKFGLVLPISLPAIRAAVIAVTVATFMAATCMAASAPTAATGSLAAGVLAGVIVEEVTAGGEFDRAGVQVGDRLIRWRYLPEEPTSQPMPSPEITSYFAWQMIDIELMPRARALRFEALRQGRAMRFDIAAGSWKVRVRPMLRPAVAAEFARGQRRLEDGDLDAALGIWQPLATSLGRRTENRTGRGEDSEAFIWLAWQMGQALVAERRNEQARELYLTALSKADEPAARIFFAEALGKLGIITASFDDARKRFEATLDGRRAMGGHPLGMARSHYFLGYLANQEGDLRSGEEHYEAALKIFQRVADGSLPHGHALIGMGQIRAQQGELRQAAELWRRTLVIYDQFEHGGSHRAGVLLNLGTVLVMEGDVLAGEGYFRQAMESDPNSLQAARIWNNLGELAMIQGDVESAEQYLTQAFELKEIHRPGHPIQVSTLQNLGMVAVEKGDFERAEKLYRQALAIAEEAKEGSLKVAKGLFHLGRVAMYRGDVEAALSRYRQALAMLQEVAPAGGDMVVILLNLGDALLSLDDLEGAERRYREAVAVLAEMAPTSSQMARGLSSLGEVRWQAKDLAGAEDLFRRALEALEGQVQKLGGTHELRRGFRASYQSIYRDFIKLLVQLDRPADAFGVLERSRARGFLELLSHREMVFQDAPAALENEHRQIARSYDRLQAQLVSPAGAGDRRDDLLQELADLRRQRSQLVETLRRSAPRLASLRYPTPLEPAETLRQLDSGTLLVAYSVGEEETFLFTLSQQGPPRVIQLPVTAQALKNQINRWLSLLPDAATTSTQGRRRAAAAFEAAGWLYDQLLAPIADQVASAQRLLILPDGALHGMPFGALVDRSAAGLAGGSAKPGRYLVEQLPFHIAPSATVHAELRSLPASKATSRLASFGAPYLPPSLQTPASEQHSSEQHRDRPRLRSMLDRGFSFEPLPAARWEAEQVATLFPGSTAYVGAEATEERVKRIDGVRYLHFATHAWVDEHLPLDSALVLSMPDSGDERRDNGLLQVWEILEGVRFDAEMVTLSACGTALGQPIPGEGMIGLTRAFHFAGARTVVASLWPVADRATSQLMVRFYHHLGAGLAKDEALRAAQLEMLAGIEPAKVGGPRIDPRAPYFWAAFQISGDRLTAAVVEP